MTQPPVERHGPAVPFPSVHGILGHGVHPYGLLCQKLVEGNAIQVTSEIQGRMALIRDVMSSYPAESQTAAFWDRVDRVLDQQRKLAPAALAADVTNGLRADISKYTQSDASTEYTLVDKTSISSESLQARADLAMREYFKMQREHTGLPGGRKKRKFSTPS